MSVGQRADDAFATKADLAVSDAAAFGALLDELNSAGGITGVIHGAGVIEDKLLRDKTPESFDRVFETKVETSDGGVLRWKLSGSVKASMLPVRRQ